MKNYTLLAAFVVPLIILLFIPLFFVYGVAPSETSPTQQQQTIDAAVNQRFTATALAQQSPLTATAAFNLTVDASFNLALTATVLANGAPAASNTNVDSMAYATDAEKSRESRALTAPGWRRETIPSNPNAAPRSNPAYWTKPSLGTDWIVWSFTPKASGLYQVSVYIPSLRNAPARNTRSAHYHVTFSGGGTMVSVDQSTNIGNEVALGKFEFDAGMHYAVFLDDNTGESGNVAIAADTVSWTYASGQSPSVIDVPATSTPEPNRARIPSGTAVTVGDDARLWSAPDVKSGKLLRSLAPGTQVLIVSGPVIGPIRYDSDVIGDWYQVTYSFDDNPLGWIWSEVINSSSGY